MSGEAETETHGDPDLAAVGRLLAEPARSRILLALDDGRALPASRLAEEAGVSPSTASEHLRRLTAGGLLTVEAHGRHRYYRIADPSVGRLIESVGALAPRVPVRSLREGTRAEAMRRSRTCYDHLAGRLGVELLASFVGRGWIEGGSGERVEDEPLVGAGHDVDYLLTAAGREFADRFGIRLPERRRVIRYCIDWTEQRHHLAGGLGRGLRDALLERDWVRRGATSRSILVTDEGRRGLERTFGVRGV